MLAALALAASPDFALRLWNALDTSQGNVVVSPMSIEACLGLLIPGVGPSSKPPLAKTLGTRDLSAYFQKLSGRVQALTHDDETTVSNAGFFAEAPRPSYVAATKESLGATAERLLPDGAGLKQVNGWVDRHTKGRIPKLFDRLDDGTRAVLVNAVTFDGDWSTAFSANATRPMAFHAPTGTHKVPNLRDPKRMLPYAVGKGYRMVVLPYKGDRYRMTLLLPDSGDPAHLLGDDSWRAQSTIYQPVDLALPRFTVRSSPDVQTALAKMGLAPLFSHIDLSPALPGGSHDQIDQIVHRTYVKVDEKGTEAAASTGIAVKRAMPRPQTTAIFHVDRPFAFAVQRTDGGEILFEGVVREP